MFGVMTVCDKQRYAAAYDASDSDDDKIMKPVASWRSIVCP